MFSNLPLHRLPTRSLGFFLLFALVLGFLCTTTSSAAQPSPPAHSPATAVEPLPSPLTLEADDDSGANDDSDHSDPIAPVLLGILVIILAARLGGHLFEKVGQPAVLGELVVGVILGNLALFGYHGLDFLKIDYSQPILIDLHDYVRFAGITIDHLARIGVILLLFQVGLETNIADFRRVGPSALLVALLGVVAPMLLGYGSGLLLVPNQDWTIHLFLGATLAATSVGITARVLRDLNKSTTRESQIILGAAVIDDVLGLLILSVVQGIILSHNHALTTGEAATINFAALALTCFKAVGFLVGALFVGRFVSRTLFKFASRLKGSGLLVVASLAFCFGLAWLSSEVGLAPIVGAFAAGLILERVQYRELADREGLHELETLIKPLSDLFVPIFFVMMGIQVNLASFADPRVLGLAAVLIVAAVVGKQLCGLGALERGLDRRSIGIGMIPRGEVGLIFAAIGRQLQVGGQRVVDEGVYSALILMVMVTTLITPPLLKWSLNQHDQNKDHPNSHSTEHHP